MKQDNQQAMPDDIGSLGGKSWTAYVRVMFVAFGLLLVSAMAWGISIGAGVVVSLLALAFLVYQVLQIKIYHLYSTMRVSGCFPACCLGTRVWPASSGAIWMKRCISNPWEAGCSSPTPSASVTASQNPARCC